MLYQLYVYSGSKWMEMAQPRGRGMDMNKESLDMETMKMSCVHENVPTPFPPSNRLE